MPKAKPPAPNDINANSGGSSHISEIKWITPSERERLQKEDILEEIQYYKDQRDYIGVQKDAITEQKSTNKTIKRLTFVLAGAALIQIGIETIKIISKESTQLLIQAQSQSLQPKQYPSTQVLHDTVVLYPSVEAVKLIFLRADTGSSK